jgi:hypothetical protein
MRTAIIIAALLVGAAPAIAAPTEAELCAMVEKSAELKVVYKTDPAGAEVRVFDLYGVGTTSAKNLVVFGRQLSGYSPTSDGGNATLPDWRTFRVDRLTSIEDAGTNFTATAPTAADAKLVAKWSCANPAVPKAGGSDG